MIKSTAGVKSFKASLERESSENGSSISAKIQGKPNENIGHFKTFINIRLLFLLNRHGIGLPLSLLDIYP